MRPLALHQFTALDVDPIGLVSIAAQVGCQSIITWINNPPNPSWGKRWPWPDYDLPIIVPSMQKSMRTALSDFGMKLSSVELFPISETIDPASNRPCFDLASELGASRVVAHIHDVDEQRALQTFGRFCEIASEYELGVGLEFMGFIEGCSTLERALFFVKSVGLPKVGVALDFLHIVRTGASVEQVASLPERYISYAQLCDGRDLGVKATYLDEGVDRLAPGEGVWPVRELIEAIPIGIPMDIEVPSLSGMARGLSALERASHAAGASRRMLEAAGVRG